MSRKLMNLRATLAVLFAAFVWSVSAQTVTITGTVTDETGEPVIGASVLETGTHDGIYTDLDGHFTLKASG